MSPLIYTLEVVSAPKPSGVKPVNFMSKLLRKKTHRCPRLQRERTSPTRRRIGNVATGGSHVSFIPHVPPDVIRYQSHPMATVTFWWCVYADLSLSFQKVKGIGIALSFCKNTCQIKNNQENPCKHQKIMLVHLVISLSGHVISC